MSITVVLAVCVDPWLLAFNDAAWRSAAFVVIAAASIREAIDHFQAGDFDLVLLGHSISNEDMERLAFLVRASGSQTPVVSIANLTGDRDFLADRTLNNDSGALLAGMVELLAERERVLRTPALLHSTVA
jgi:DNA-binding response OmpR family regulator